MGATAFKSADGTNHTVMLIGTSSTDIVLKVSPTNADDASVNTGMVSVLQANGDLASASVGGMKQMIGTFTTTNLVTSASAVAMKLCGVAGMTQVLMPYAGSVLAITAKANAALTAGTARFAVTKNGSTVFSAVNSVTGVTVVSGTQAKDTDTFVAGDTIGVKVTTSATYAPTSLEWVVTPWVEC